MIGLESCRRIGYKKSERKILADSADFSMTKKTWLCRSLKDGIG
jgi:hypothetical protein